MCKLPKPFIFIKSCFHNNKQSPPRSLLLLLDASSSLHAEPRRIRPLKSRNPGQKSFQNTCGLKWMTRNTAKPGAGPEEAFAYLCNRLVQWICILSL